VKRNKGTSVLSVLGGFVLFFKSIIINMETQAGDK
jgi:hypothetical protein